MKRLSPLLLLLSFLLVSCYSHEKNCANFRTGTFVSERYFNGEMHRSKFVRNDSISIDYYKGEADTSSIRWVNDCSYVLRNLNPENLAEKQAIHIKILKTNGDRYTFQFSVVGEEGKAQKATARKISPDS